MVSQKKARIVLLHTSCALLLIFGFYGVVVFLINNKGVIKMNIAGILIEKFEVVHISETFKKREFVIEVRDGEYSEFIKFTSIQDKVEITDKYKIGDEIDVHFNLKGRKWTNPQNEVKYFNDLQAWMVHSVKSENGGIEPPVMGSDPVEQEEVPF
jgi:hypothetical protein